MGMIIFQGGRVQIEALNSQNQCRQGEQNRQGQLFNHIELALNDFW